MKGFVFVQGGEIALRFLKENAFRRLQERHDIIYVALKTGKPERDSGLDETLSEFKEKVVWTKYYPHRFKKWRELFNVSCIYYKDKSPSFDVRQQEKRSHQYERYRKLAQKGVFEKYAKSVDKELGLNQDILELALKERPDFFLLPSALLDRLTDDVLQIAEALKIPTLLLVAGWDNLSSKGLLRCQPEMIGVWGEQTKQHAIDVQGIDTNRISIIGSPYYDNFKPPGDAEKKKARESLGFPSDQRPIVLFAGTLRYFDETQILLDMERAVENAESPPMHIIYRPHPLRRPRHSEDDFFKYEWRHVRMDPEMSLAYKASKRNETIVPDNYLSRMDHLSKLYSAVDTIISPMSTVLLESLLFGIPIMVVAFNDGKHSWSADKHSRMLHFKELYDIPKVIVCRNRADYISNVNKLISNADDDEYRELLLERSRYFVFQDGRTYSDRVAEAVENMLDWAQESPRYDALSLRLFLMSSASRKIIKRARDSLTRRLGLAKP